MKKIVSIATTCTVLLGCSVVALANPRVSFKNHELQIIVDKNTGGVELDNAINNNGKEQQIDKISIISNNGDFEFDVKASNQKALYLSMHNDARGELSSIYPNADLTFYTFPGSPEFDFRGTAQIEVDDADKDWYLYEIIDDTAYPLDADLEDGKFTFETFELTSYIVSDQDLIVDEDSQDSDSNIEKETSAKKRKTNPIKRLSDN